jgi:hypothetical protein
MQMPGYLSVFLMHADTVRTYGYTGSSDVAPPLGLSVLHAVREENYNLIDTSST